MQSSLLARTWQLRLLQSVPLSEFGSSEPCPGELLEEGGDQAKLAAETGLTITVCHLPPGTSKWNNIGHRLFSQITRNWAGWPLRTHQTNRLPDLGHHHDHRPEVSCVLDTGQYPPGCGTRRRTSTPCR